MFFVVSHEVTPWRDENATIYTKEGKNIRQLALKWTDAGLGVTSDCRLVTATSDHEIGLVGYYDSFVRTDAASRDPQVRANGDRTCTRHRLRKTLLDTSL